MSLNGRIIALTFLSVLVSACGSIETSQEASQPQAVEATQTEREQPPTDPVQQAIWFAERANTQQQAAAYYFQAAKLRYQQGYLHTAIRLLEDRVLPYQEGPSRLESLTIAAAIQLEHDQPLVALSYLSQAKRTPGADFPDAKNKISLLRVAALEALGSWPAAVKERLKLSLTLSNPEDAASNHQQLWLSVQNLTDGEVAYLKHANDSLLTGWLNISSILRERNSTISDQLSAFEKWRTTHPLHPAAVTPPEDFLILANLEQIKPTAISLMLPLSGNLKSASQALIQGFLSAYYQEQGERPTLHFVDTDSYSTVEEALAAAQEQSPDIIIGPLQKNLVAQLSRLSLETPLIALNQLESPEKVENLHYFSLTSEDDIRELIHFAKQENASRAAILTTQAAWALRQGDEFHTISQQEDIDLVAQLDYEDTPRGRQKAIQELLLVNESQERRRTLEKWIGTSVKSTDRSRKDLDYVFFAGRIEDAKQIRPLLDFYFAEEIPMLAGNTINNAPPGKQTKDEDIERIVFSEIPALLRPNPALAQAANAAGSNILKRLQAMGADAYTLANRYTVFHRIPAARMSANTGILTMDEQQVFHKRPELVTYKKGKLENVDKTYFEGSQFQ